MYFRRDSRPSAITTIAVNSGTLNFMISKKRNRFVFGGAKILIIVVYWGACMLRQFFGRFRECTGELVSDMRAAPNKTLRFSLQVFLVASKALIDFSKNREKTNGWKHDVCFRRCLVRFPQQNCSGNYL